MATTLKAPRVEIDDVVYNRQDKLDRYLQIELRKSNLAQDTIVVAVEDALAKAVIFKNDCFASSVNLFIRYHRILIDKTSLMDTLYDYYLVSRRMEHDRLMAPYGTRLIYIEVPTLSYWEFYRMYKHQIDCTSFTS